MGADNQEVIKTSNLVDGDLLAGFLFALFRFQVYRERFGLQQAKIRMVALAVPVACEASAARNTCVLRLFAKQAGGKQLGELKLADPFLTNQE
jgi:hypothetical protein